MNIIKCKLCRQSFHSYGSQICTACMEQIDKDFFVVRDYIDDNPGKSNIDQIAEATEVKKEHIIYLIEEGRLATSGTFGNIAGTSAVKCQVCGRPTSGGPMCDGCKAALSKELGLGAAGLGSNKPSTYKSPRSNR